MLKPITDSFKQVYPHEAAEKAERRKVKRNHDDFMFDRHHWSCPQCKDKTFQQIKDYEHRCDRGFMLAIKASISRRQMTEL